jgi:cysteine-rich repeat protein
LQSGDTQNPIDLIPSDIRTNKPLMILSASTNEVISGIQYDAQLPKQDPDSTDSIRTIISSNTKANGFCAFTPYDLKPVSGSEVHVQSVYGNFRHGPGATLRWSFRPSYGQYAQYLPSSIVEITDVKGEVQQREVLQDSTKIFFEEGDYDQSIQWRVRPIFYYGTDNTRIYGEWSPMHTFIPITPACGNAFTEMDEQCDDGNMLDEDGCNASCFIEADYSCRQGNGNTAASTCRTYQELVYAAIDGGVDGNSDGALEPYEVAIARADLQDSETMQHPKYDFDNSGTVNERDLAIFSQYAPSY